MSSSGISESRPRELINAAAPAATGGEVRIVGALGGGGGAQTFEVEGPAGRFIARVVDSGPGVARLEKERRLGEFLNALGIPAPRITIHETPEAAVGIYRKIEGEMFSGELYGNRFSERDREVFVEEMAQLLSRLHAVPLDSGCRAFGVSFVSAEEAARKFRFGGWFDAEAIEAALSGELVRDAELKAIWDETRRWFDAFESVAADTVFGHGDLHGGNMAIARTEDGYRLAGVFDLQIGGIVNIYDEFLRIMLIDEVAGPRIVEAYNRLPGRKRKVDRETLGHAYRSFVFYLAHENAGDFRTHLIRMVKQR